jgi:hypothetical protein
LNKLLATGHARASKSIASDERALRLNGRSFAMSIRIIGASLFVLALFSGTGCNNTNCEQGAYCVDGEPAPKRDGGRECLMLCGQLALCGAPQAEDFNACVADCDARFESDPEETAMLCACAEWSSCEDITNNRCSDRPHGSGGSGSGGASGASGSGASGGTAGAVGSAGTGAAGTGGTGPITCGRDCDCPLPDVCVGGYCVAP